MKYLTFTIFLLATIIPTFAPQSPAGPQAALRQFSVEYEKECGNPLRESTFWTSLEGEVVEVLRGNELIIRLANNERKHVSLAGLDSSTSSTLAAQALLANLLLNRKVSVLTNLSGSALKRITGVVHVEKRDVNRELIKEGAAKFQSPPPYSMSDYTSCIYRIVEKQAREDRRGIWAKDNPYPSFAIKDSKYFTDKLGKPVELFRHKSGVNVEVAYDDKGKACQIFITDPGKQKYPSSFPKLLAVANEIMPLSDRGVVRGDTREVGNCIDVEYWDYDAVFVELNRDACYEQWIRILFKRDLCPKPRQIPGLRD
jgi:endonuclease YncB( thermonuclease family)